MSRIPIQQCVRAVIFVSIGWSLVAATAARAADMTFSLHKVMVGNGILSGPLDVVVADGDITGATPQLFDRFIATNNVPSGTLMALNSGGGFLDAGLEVGKAIRKAGLNTEVAAIDSSGRLGQATCASACTFMFLGGVVRSLALGSQFGVHRFARSNQPDDLQYAQQESAKLIAYVKQMGVNTSMIELMARQGPEDITWVTPQDMASLNITSSRHTDYRFVGQGDAASLVITTTEGGPVPGQIAFSCSPQGLVARVAFNGGDKVMDWSQWALSWSTENDSFAMTTAPASRAQIVKSSVAGYAMIDSAIPANVLSAAIAGGAWIGAYANNSSASVSYRDSVDLDDAGRTQLNLMVKACQAR